MRKFFIVLVWGMGLGLAALFTKDIVRGVRNVIAINHFTLTETDLMHEEKDKGFSPKKNPQKLMKEMDQIVQDDIKNIH